MASSIVPAIYDSKIADEDLPVSSEGSYAMVKRLARQEGMLVGISGGAAIVELCGGRAGGGLRIRARR